MAKVELGGKEGAALNSQGKPTTEVFEDKRPKREAAPPLEMKAGNGVSPPVVDGPEIKAETISKPEEDHIDAEDRDLSDIALEEARVKAQKKITKYANRWQAELKAKEKLVEEVAESERFAENLFNEREAYRKKAEEAEAKAAALEAQKPKSPEFIAPDEKDPKYYNDKQEFNWKQFSTDNAAYEAKKAIAEDRKTREAEQQQAQAEAAKLAFRQKADAAIKKNPDWEEVVTKSPLLLQNEALAYIAQSDYGTDIAYFLAKNPLVSEKIKALHPIRAIAAIRDIETGFEKPAPAPAAPASEAPSKTAERQGAPAPITPISTSGTTPIPVDPAKMDFKQLRAYERERAKRR